MLDQIGQILSSDAFRGGALLATALSGVIAVILLLLKQRPLWAKLEDEARIALDASTHAELKRLAERLDQADKRSKECEDERLLDHKRIRALEEEIAGLRRQLVQFQESQVRLLANAGAVPADMVATLKVIK